MKPEDFILTIKNRTAITAVGPSALRGQGAGVLGAAQTFLSGIDLSKIRGMKQKQFNHWLDMQTKLMLKCLPCQGKPWGTARKALNLYLRDTLYNQYLCAAYKTRIIEQWLEIPLDSAVAKGLKHSADKDEISLPAWPGLKHLTKEISEKYQQVAMCCAAKKGIFRVHLDIYLWTDNR